MAAPKNPTAIQIGQRIKQARKMAGFNTAGQLLEEIPQWSKSRLGNYEAGISLPSPEDIRRVAAVTDASPCWIMFGSGPIRSNGRDLQAIRHQNFVYLWQQLKSGKLSTAPFLQATGLSINKIEQFLANPFLEIPPAIISKIEKFTAKTSGWMDEQHVESDPICAAFPDDMRALMEIYSNLAEDKRSMLMQVARVFGESPS